MEAAGLTLSAVAIATLFNTCVECFETFSQGRNLQRDFSYLIIRLDFEKTQLLLWGASSGILKVESEDRLPRLADSAIYKLVKDALNAIHALLSDAKLLSERYGVEPSAATPEIGQSTSTDILSSNGMTSFRISWSRFCVRAARLLPERGHSSTLAKARWAVHDRSKFTELLETLSTLVGKLHEVIPVPNSQYADLESDLEAILDISQLSLVEKALQSSSNPKGRALSHAASVIISNSEAGTVDRRTIVEWLQDTEWINSSDVAYIPSPAMQGLNLTGILNYLQVDTPKSLYIVNTPKCYMQGGECDTITTKDMLSLQYIRCGSKFHAVGFASIRSLFLNLARSANFKPPGTGVRAYQTLPFAKFYILTSPCHCAIQTAMDIAKALNQDHEPKAIIRLDDRITSCCLPSPSSRVKVLMLILAHLDALEPRIHPPWSFLDRAWLDQRLHSLEEYHAITGESSPEYNPTDIFEEDNFPGSFAGLIVIGEVDFCAPLLLAEPFPGMPRSPRACEVYEITHVNELYKRKYISSFVPRKSFNDEKRIISGTNSTYNFES